ncbi:hypothetical protein Ddye_025460, partial [Dipteronia dyeriana]
MLLIPLYSTFWSSSILCIQAFVQTNICIGHSTIYSVQMNPDSYFGRTSNSNFDLNQGGPSTWETSHTTYNNYSCGGSSYNTNDQEGASDHSLFTDHFVSTPH